VALERNDRADPLQASDGAGMRRGLGMAKAPEQQIGEAEERADSGRNQGFVAQLLGGEMPKEVGDDFPGLVDDIPGVPSMESAQGDAQPGQKRRSAHKQPAQRGSEPFGYDSVDQVQREEPGGQSCETEPDQEQQVDPGPVTVGPLKVDEVGENVGGIGQEQEPWDSEREGAAVQAAAGEDLDTECKCERDDGEDQIPEQVGMADALGKGCSQKPEAYGSGAESEQREQGATIFNAEHGMFCDFDSGNEVCVQVKALQRCPDGTMRLRQSLKGAGPRVRRTFGLWRWPQRPSGRRERAAILPRLRWWLSESRFRR